MSLRHVNGEQSIVVFQQITSVPCVVRNCMLLFLFIIDYSDDHGVWLIVCLP